MLLRAKPGYFACPLHLIPPKGWGKPYKSPLQPDSWEPPLLSSHKRNSLPPFEEQAREPIMVFTLPTPLHQGHNKDLPEFFA